MSIVSALYAGVTGMFAMSKSMQVTGNNIANINTVGFKGSRASFADLLSASINTPSGKQQVGRGVRTVAIENLFHQGSFESTPVVTDVALNGDGYFVLTTEFETFYTRAGEFRIDKDGNLVNALGMFVNGYEFQPNGELDGDMVPISLSSETSPPNATGDGTEEGTGMFLNINLNSEAPIRAFDPDDPGGSSNFATAVTLYDSLGAPHTATLYFNKTADNEWEWRAMVDGGEITGGTEGTLVEGATGTLSFDANGNLTNQTVDASDFDFVNGAEQNQVVGWDFTGSTQVDSESVTNSITQDGFPPGSLQAIDIDREGVITGIFSNGLARPLYQFAVASFAAETELFREGNSLFIETAKAGQPVYSTPNAGTNGTIAASTLELSNVDLTEEFVDMITTQRAFQANSKTIMTSDQMLETVINMKR
ncbi:MAG: flagellar hook protein FlgE [Candidatus Sumerlaeia bacterium]